jgi:tetratricopeptide (TPR) repeat protein
VTAAGTPDDRDVVPRWRPFGHAVRSGETAPLARRAPLREPSDLSESEAAFRDSPGNYTAADLVGAAFTTSTRSELAMEAARGLVDDPDAGAAPRDLARALLDWAAYGPRLPEETDPPQLDFLAVRQRAGQLRRILRSEPRNAVRWADLALAHTVLGHPQQAEREIRTALAIAGPNRFLLRAAARLYVHMDRSDDAHELLTRDPSVLEDPWLAAAELATATLAGRTSRHTRRARQLVDDTAGHAPRHLSELASQVATAELRAGKARHAKRLMAVALREPTENALAQAEWASANGLTLQEANLEGPRTYEARALRFSHAGDWAAASAAGMEWLADQPFAQEAAQFTSYAASVGAEDWALAQRAAEAGLVANPDDHMLRNNLAFALANQALVADAYEHFRVIPWTHVTGRERAVLVATEGLLLFRSGQAEDGRHQYRAAINAFNQLGDADHAALATAFWAREEIMADTDHAGQAVAASKQAAEGTRFPAAELWTGRLAGVTVPPAPVAALPRQRPTPTSWN